MPQSVMHDATPLRPVPSDEPVVTGVDTMTGEVFDGLGIAQLNVGLGTREQIQSELDDMAASVRAFYAKQPDQVLRECAAYTARLTELCVLLHRVESLDRQYTRVRTQQVERWLAELDRQFKIASRLIEVMRQDIQLSGAAT